MCGLFLFLYFDNATKIDIAIDKESYLFQKWRKYDYNIVTLHQSGALSFQEGNDTLIGVWRANGNKLCISMYHDKHIPINGCFKKEYKKLVFAKSSEYQTWGNGDWYLTEERHFRPYFVLDPDVSKEDIERIEAAKLNARPMPDVK
jgi:hypothetical protein